jgi:hypothetical protein
MKVSMIECVKLQAHPRNYREHPTDQIDHIKQSLTQFGFYRNVVATKQNVILAGHGVVKAATELGLKQVPVMQVDLDKDSPEALKILTGDNEIASLGIVDDRELTALLKEIRDSAEDGLLGTGFDDDVLANLVMVTRSGTEIENFDAAAEWVGMPEYEGEAPEEIYKIILAFPTAEKRNAWVTEHVKLETKSPAKMISSRVPPVERRDNKAVKFEEQDAPKSPDLHSKQG